jgi:hypothetical protein
MITPHDARGLRCPVPYALPDHLIAEAVGGVFKANTMCDMVAGRSFVPVSRYREVSR